MTFHLLQGPVGYTYVIQAIQLIKHESVSNGVVSQGPLIKRDTTGNNRWVLLSTVGDNSETIEHVWKLLNKSNTYWNRELEAGAMNQIAPVLLSFPLTRSRTTWIITSLAGPEPTNNTEHNHIQHSGCKAAITPYRQANEAIIPILERLHIVPGWLPQSLPHCRTR